MTASDRALLPSGQAKNYGGGKAAI